MLNYLNLKLQFSNILKSFLVVLASYYSAEFHSQVTSVTYNFTGAMQTFVVPSCASSVTISAYGAKGAPGVGGNIGVGGNGGLAQGVLAVTPGQTYNIFVGGTNGYNGGANPGAGGPFTSGTGGGASDVRFGGVALANRIITAGGGGGGGGGPQVSCNAGVGGNGGVGGNLTGGNGTTGTAGFCGNGGSFGSGGTQAAGGAAGTGNFNCGGPAGNGFAGALGIGGNGGLGIMGCGCYIGAGGAGGGGGYYGGGGGGGGNGGCGGAYSGGGGGGGSSNTGALASPVLNAGVQNGNGQVIIQYNCVLPIELTEFTAHYNGSYVYLTWKTASEKNSNYFTIEKAMEGGDFALMDKIASAGNSKSEKLYTLNDYQPYTHGVNYYLLKQYDLDGTLSFEKMISLSVIEKIYEFSLSPNPAEDNVALRLSDDFVGENVKIELINSVGQMIFNDNIDKVISDQQIQILNLKELPKGFYFVRVISGQGSIRWNKLVKN